MKKIKYLFSLLLFLCVACKSDLKKQKELFLEKNAIDFGNIKSNKSIDFSIKIINENDTPDTIVKFNKSCGCTTIKKSSYIVEANSALIIKLNYDPKNDLDKIAKSVMLKSAKGTLLIFRFKAVVSK